MYLMSQLSLSSLAKQLGLSDHESKQLGLSDYESRGRDLRSLRALRERVSDMYSKEKDLVSVEDLLGRHEAVWHFAQMACQELEAKIDAFDGAVKRSGHPGLSVDGIRVCSPLYDES
jgi:hypothetical protein